MRTMISASEARELVIERANAVTVGSIELAPEAAAGLVLARAVTADRDYPPFDGSVMDGFAVRLVHAGRTVAIRGEARPGLPPSGLPDDDGCVEIMTGAPVPAGTEAVVMKEQARRDSVSVTLPTEVLAGQNIVPRGSECRAGAEVLPLGARLTPIALGLLASVGCRTVRAHPLPRLALLVTGDEVVPSNANPGCIEIRDANGPMLSAMVRPLGVACSRPRGVRDTAEALAAALEQSSEAEVVVLTGGVSAGNYDLVPAALVSHGATIVFHKVRQQPGKPILFAVKGDRLFFGLPGTPLGCHFGFHHYVLPAVRMLAGLPPRAAEVARLVDAWSTQSDRQQFVLARVGRSEASWTITPLVPKGSSDLFTPWAANAYMHVEEGTRDLAVGAHVTFEWLEATA